MYFICGVNGNYFKSLSFYVIDYICFFHYSGSIKIKDNESAVYPLVRIQLHDYTWLKDC